MKPSHHPPDELLVHYAAGETPADVALVVACHATLCPDCARQLAELEALGGALLAEDPGTALTAGALERTLAALDAPAPPLTRATAPAPSALVDPPLVAGLALPRPLLRQLGPAAAWKRVVPGVEAVKLPLGGPGTLLRLLRLRPGVRIPLHDHGGTELTQVFSGGLIEPDQALHRGDFALRQPGERHLQRVEPGAPCVALILNAGPLLPLTFLGRLLTFIARE